MCGRARPTGPTRGRVAGAVLLAGAHDAGIDEGRGDVGDLRELGIAGHHDGDAVLAGQGDEFGLRKLSCRTSTACRIARPSTVFGQQLEEAGEILRVEFLGRPELPVDRAELVA